MMRLALPLSLAAFLVIGCGQQTDATAPSPTTPTTPTDPTGATTVEVNQGTNMAVAVAPDGASAVISLQGKLFTLPAEGGAATAITDDYFDAREPAWSRDGKHIVFHGYRSGNWDLWRVDAQGGEPTLLTDDPFDDREPMYSPRNDDVVFSSDRSGNYDIWLLANGATTQLTTSAQNEHSPAWSPAGTEVAYARAISSRQYEIHIQPVADGPARQVVAEAGEISGIAWRPDGGALSYRLRTIAPTTGELVSVLRIVDANTGVQLPAPSADTDVFPFRANWLSNDTLLYTASGDIKKLALDEVERTVPFTAEFELNRIPYERRARTYDTTLRPVLGIALPTVDNRGRIAFGALGDLWLHDTSTGATTQITDDPFADQSPQFSPDGNKLAFISDRSGAPKIWIHDFADGSFTPVPGDVVMSGISWSPDGRLLAGFEAIPGNALNSQLTTVNINSGVKAQYLEPLSAQQTSWSPDGAHLATTRLNRYSSRYREGVYELLRTNVRTGTTTTHSAAAHKSMLNTVLAADNESYTFVQDGLLWRAPLVDRADGTNAPEAITNQLSDTPSWSADGKHLVFMSGDELVHVTQGKQTTIAHGLTYQQQMPQAPANHWVLRPGRVFDGISNRYQDNVDIIVRDNRIEAIVPRQEHALRIVALPNSTAMPGLFEMHAHMGANSEVQGRTWLAYGVTSVRDPGSDPYVAKVRQEAWDSGKRIGPRTHITGYLTDGNRVFYSVAEGMTSRAHLERALDRSRRLKLDFIKTYVRLPDEWQARVVEAAHVMGIPTSSHELFPAVAHGMDHVEHLGGTSRRGYQPKVSQTGHVYGDVIELLAASGMGITPTAVLPGFALVASDGKEFFATPQFQHFYGPALQAGYEAAAKRSKPLAASRTRANGEALRALVDAGALVVTGTDSPFVPYGAGLHAELRLYAMAGLTPFETLRAATSASAQAAGVLADTGTLETGKLADIVVVTGDPLADIRDADNVVMTVKNGVAYTLEELLQSPASASAMAASNVIPAPAQSQHLH